MKFNYWLNIWLNKYLKPSIKVKTFENYERTIKNHISPILGNYEIEELTTKILQDFVLEKLEKGNLITGKPLSSNTVITISSVLKHSIRQAMLFDFTEKDNTSKVKLPHLNAKKITAFEKEEQDKLVDFCLNSKKSNHIGIVICLYTGIRIGELLALTWNDIDLKKCLMNISKNTYGIKQNGKYTLVVDSPKTKNSVRIIPIPKSLAKILNEIKKKSQSQYVISNCKNNIVDTRSYQRTFKRIQRNLFIPYKNFHALRHTFATRALEMGMDVKTLAEILGHKNAMITLDRYTHSLMSYKREMMNKLGKNLELEN